MIKFNPQSRKCLICGADRFRKFKAHAADTSSPYFVNIIECKKCFFAWQFPVERKENQSVQFFETAYADDGQTQSKYFNSSHKRKIAKLEYEFLSRLPVKNRTLLDIGAGSGIFAEVAAENDWNVTAVDPALDIDRIRNNPMIKAVKGTTEQITERELFDVVTMWDVIEHTANPFEQISIANKYLKEGGWLVIETGNYKSASRVNRGSDHWMYQLEHRWYFSPDSIKYILKEAGFSELIFSDKELRPGWKGSVEYAGPSRARLIKSIFKDPLNFPMHLYKFFCLIRAKGWERSGIGIFTIAAMKPIAKKNNSDQNELLKGFS